MILFNRLVKKAESTIEADHRFLQTLIDAIPTPVFYKDIHGRYLGGNKAFEEYNGLPTAQLIGKTAFDLLPPHLANHVCECEQELLKKQGLLVEEAAMPHSDGTLRNVIYLKTTFPAADGSLGGLIGTMLDISDRKKIEEELGESRQYLSDVIQFFPDATLVIDNEGKVTAWNHAMEELTGVKAEEILGKGDYEYAIPFYGERRPILIDLVTMPEEEFEEKYPRIEKRGNTLFGEAYIHNAQGEQLYFHGTAAALHNSRGEIIGSIESVRDISGRKQMEDELRALTCGIEQSPVSIVITDREGNIEYVNPKFTHLTGYTSGEAIGQNPRVLKSGLTPPEVYENLWKTIINGFDWHGEFCNKKKSGELYWESASISPIANTEGNITRFIAVKEDITEKKRAEGILAEKERLLSSILDGIQDGICMLDEDLRIVRVNPFFERYYAGKMPFLGKKCHEVFWSRTEPCEECPSLRTLQSGECASMVFSDNQSGKVAWFELVSFPLLDSGKSRVTGIVEYVRDITRRKNAEEEVRLLNEKLELSVKEKTDQLLDAQEELVRKEKLAILGQLSGSVEHELRNPLGVMSNAVYFLKMVNANADETTREYLNIIKHEIDNSQRIITDLLDFARTKTPQTKMTSVRELLDGSIGKCVVPDTIDLQTYLPDTLPLLRIDPFQMEQVFQNLITNAIQAMPDGGELRLRAQQVRGTRCEEGPRSEERKSEETNLEPQSSNLNPRSSILDPGSSNLDPPEDFVEISIDDTGEGISPENMKKLFQPLFTTKAKGIGLGLVVCRNLTEANGGRIEVKSESGKGTTFTIILPVKQAEVGAAQAA